MSIKATSALELEPGIGVGAEYTDNAKLVSDNRENDLITVGYVGARVSEKEGPLQFSASTTLNKQRYAQDTFADQRYFSLAGDANWEMIRNKVDWFTSDVFTQRTVNSLNTNTPDNLQDTNAFTLGTNIRFIVSARQSFSLTPTFNQFYYEQLATDNRQYSLSGSWNYQMSRLTNISLNLSTRTIDYFEQAISDTTFTNYGVTVSGRRLRSNYAVNLGSTNVKRGDGEGEDGFSGFVNWTTEMSSRSTFDAIFSTNVTDTSSVALNAFNNSGDQNDVQITTDVIRNTSVNLSYLRDDTRFNSSIRATYTKLKYSDNPLDRVVRALGAELNYPISQLLSSGISANYNRTKQLDSGRLDERYALVGNLRYKFTRKLKGSIDLKYRKKVSSAATENFDERSIFASLVYGFGDVQRPSRAGGF